MPTTPLPARRELLTALRERDHHGRRQSGNNPAGEVNVVGADQTP